MPYQLLTWRKSCRNLRQITLQSASSHDAICIKLVGNPYQVAWLSASEYERDRMQLQGGQHGQGGLSLVNGWKGNDNSPIRIDRNRASWRHREGTWRMGRHKKGAPGTLYPRGSGWKEAATYSPALHCSTIGASGLYFSVRNGKRWDPTAITTWCIFFSSQVCFCWRVDCWLVDKLFVSFVAFALSSNSFTRLPSTC